MGVAFRGLPSGRSRLRLPQSRDRALQGEHPCRILAAYGRNFDPRELLAYTLLHAQSNLPEALKEFPAPPEPTLDSLALAWFGTA